MTSDRRGSTGTALLAVAAAAALFGTTGTAAALGPDDLSPVTAGVWRSVVGGLALLAVTIARGEAPWRYPARPGVTLLGGVAVAAYQLTFFEAVDRTGVAIGTLVTIGVGPAVAGIIDAVTGRHRPTVHWFAGATLAVAGVALLSGAGDDIDPGGLALAVFAGASFPVYGFAAQRLMTDRPVVPSMTTVFGVGAVLVLPVALASSAEAFASAGSVATVLYLGLATLALAYVLWGVGLRSLRLSVVVVVTLLEPAVAATLAVLVLDEALTIALAAGVVLVACGVVLASRGAEDEPLPAR